MTKIAAYMQAHSISTQAPTHPCKSTNPFCSDLHQNTLSYVTYTHSLNIRRPYSDAQNRSAWKAKTVIARHLAYAGKRKTITIIIIIIM